LSCDGRFDGEVTIEKVTGTLSAPAVFAVKLTAR